MKQPQMSVSTLITKAKGMMSQVLLASLLMLFTITGHALEKITYFHLDAVGSPVAATDESGDLKWREQYQPYGKRILKEGDAENSVWFTGKTEDIGLTYMGARWYDPELGRFLSVDPVGFVESSPISFNRYAYANNNPYKYVDPDGEFAVIAAIALAYAVFEVASTTYDVYDAVTTVSDPNASIFDKGISVGGLAAGVFLPGPGAAYKQGAKTVANSVDSASDTARQALRKAKEANGIPKSAQPTRTIKPNTPEGSQLGLDNRNVKLYEYTNSSGQKIHVRQDKAASYGQGGVGDQKSHFNAGPAGQKLKQHHYYGE